MLFWAYSTYMETARTMMLKPAETDYDDVFNLQSNERVREYLGGSVTKEEFPEKFKELLDARLPDSYWIVRQKGTNAFIGLVCIAPYHDQIHHEVSYEIHPKFWGDGYGTEIIERVLEYGFSVLELEEMYAETQKNNFASIKLLEKVGMRFRFGIERFGADQVVYSIRRWQDNL